MQKHLSICKKWLTFIGGVHIEGRLIKRYKASKLGVVETLEGKLFVVRLG